MAGDLSDIKADVPQFAEGDFGDNDIQLYLPDFFDDEQIDDSVDFLFIVPSISIGYGSFFVESYGAASGKSSSRTRDGCEWRGAYLYRGTR